MNAKLFDARSVAVSPLEEDEAIRGPLVLVDRSLWPRAGIKGAKATDWLASRGAAIPTINAALRQNDRSLLIRLAGNEYVSLAETHDAVSPPGGLPDFMFDGDNEPDICPVPRFAANAWFTIAGQPVSDLFAKLCSVDLRPHKFADHLVAQTIVARTTAILVRDDVAGWPRFHILADWTTSQYLWGAIVDAMDEYGS